MMEHYQQDEDQMQMTYTDQDVILRMPVKKHIEKLDGMIEGFLIELEDSAKDTQKVRGDLQTISLLVEEQNSELIKFIQVEQNRLQKEFKQVQDSDQNDLIFIKAQLNQITQEKIKIQQNVLVLDNRVGETEKDLGFQF